ncbi:hypothetical protein FXO38_03450 [Capsicum annuum]|nr:hypothetical protein FXO38_03450 [Capsicum annuum]
MAEKSMSMRDSKYAVADHRESLNSRPTTKPPPQRRRNAEAPLRSRRSELEQCMSLYTLQLLFTYRNLKPLNITPPPLPSLAMKDRPPLSCGGAVYVPPHQRLRSLITVPSTASIDHQKPNSNNTVKSSYPYLAPPQQQQQQQQQAVRLQHKRSPQFDEISELTPYQVGEITSVCSTLKFNQCQEID